MSESSTNGSIRIIMAAPRDPWASSRAVWRLAGALAKQRIASRFAGSWMGYFWSLAYPLGLAIVYAAVFSVIARAGSDPHGYAAFICSGMFFWIFLSGCLAESTTALLEAKPLIAQCYFPRWVVPCAVSLSNLFLFLCTLPALWGVLLFLGVRPHAGLLLLPVLAALAWAFSFGAALALAPLSVLYRDMQHVVNLVLTPAFFLTPVLYPAESLTDAPTLAWLVRLNPATPYLHLMRHCFLAPHPDVLRLLALATLYAGCALASGFWIFRRLERAVAIRL
jgi:ABC-type polysaccharide/polyol phosphate export permease